MIVQLARWLMKLCINIITLVSTFVVAACAADVSVSPTTPVAGTVAIVSSIEPSKSVFNGAEPYTPGSIPAHLLEEPVRVAIMLPLSGDEEKIGKALLNAATMALFDAYDSRISLIPFDTKGKAEGAVEVVQAVLDADIDVVLGPLFSDSIRAAGPRLALANITMIGFSSDARVAGPGRFIMGFAPEDEVRRVVRYAVKKGHENFAALIPLGLYGSRVSAALGDVIEENSARMMAMEEYQPDASAVASPIRRLANYDVRRRMRNDELRALRDVGSDLSRDLIQEIEKKEVLGDVNFSAVLVPEGGQLLRSIAPYLPYYEVDPNKVQFLGTGLWNDVSVQKEPPLYGAWFAAPEPSRPAEFMAKYEDIYGEKPPRIATLAYDAMALISYKMRHPVAEERFTLDALLDQRGFHGIDGLFRFKMDGTVERALAILEVTPKNFIVIEKAPKRFPRFENYAIRPLEK